MTLDPYLSSQYAVQFVKGMQQGEDPRYMDIQLNWQLAGLVNNIVAVCIVQHRNWFINDIEITGT